MEHFFIRTVKNYRFLLKRFHTVVTATPLRSKKKKSVQKVILFQMKINILFYRNNT